MTGERASAVARVFRFQATICRAGKAPVSADLLEYAAGEVEAGGPTAAVFDSYEEDPARSYAGVRFLAAIHRLALTGRALELASHFPTAGGIPQWPYLGRAFTALVEERTPELRAWIQAIPQTNEVGRAAALSLGLHKAAAGFPGLPLRLLEPGASAGLNLRWDRYRVVAGEHAWGPEDATVVVEADFEGPPPVVCEKIEVVSRRGCDLAPYQLVDAEDRGRLEAYVWPDHVERLMRLRRAIAAFFEDPVYVQEAAAGGWLVDELAQPEPAAITAVFHSSFDAYLPVSERHALVAAIEGAGERAGPGAPLVWLRLEEDGPGVSLWLRTWPGGADLKLAQVADHGARIRHLVK
jgi:hypothetical protein